MAPKRKRDDVTSKWLAGRLMPFVSAGGVSWLRYDHNANVKKCNHIIGFVGGKALERDKLVKTKIDLLSQDYAYCAVVR